MDAENRENTREPHTLSLRDCSLLEMRGVTDVISFDEETVELSTQCGNLTVEGNGLHVKVLNLAEGHVSVDGTVTALIYTGKPETDSKGFQGLFHKRGR